MQTPADRETLTVANKETPTLVGRTIAGRYSVKSRIGAGGMGDVYFAEDAQLRSPVALKALREAVDPTAEGRARLLREARAAAALRGNAHIAVIYDVLDGDGVDTPPLIVMEYVDGVTLSDRLTKGRLTIVEALQFARDISDALAFAHRQGIVHRDLKPGNLRISQEGRIKVLDFGLAQRIAPVVDTSGMSVERVLQTIVAQHRIAGTPGYMAPEQALGRKIEPAADIFSLGVVLFEMLTGRRPFPGNDLVSAGIAMMTLPIPRVADVIPGIAPSIDALLSRMLAREPVMRSSAEDVAAELRALLKPGGASERAHALRIGTAVITVPAWPRLVLTAGVMAILVGSAITLREPLRRAIGDGPSGPSAPIVLGIMPIDAPGGDPKAEYLGAGITSVVAGNFGSVPRVTVLSRAATAPYQQDRDDYAALQRALGTTHVLRLSWKTVEPTLRLEARLYKPGDSEPQWAETLEGDAATIEHGLLVGLGRTFEHHTSGRSFTREEWSRLSKIPTASGAARMAYAEARALLNRPVRDVDRSIALLQQATTLDPDFVFAWAELGDAWWNKYQLDKNPAWAANATSALWKAVALDPDSAPVHYALGDTQYRTGDLTQAEASFRRALQLQPDYDAAQRNLAQVLAATGRIDEAVGLLQQAIRFSTNWNNYFMLGTIDYRAGRYEAAAQAFTLATQAAPNNAGAHTMLGISQYVLGNLQQAIGNFEHAVRLGPTAAAYSNLGLAYYDKGLFEDALHSYEQALQREPRSVVNHRNIADVEWRLGHRQEARAHFERAIALGNETLTVNPRDARTIGLVALCEAKLGQRVNAERHAAEAVAVDSANWEAWQRSAEVHALLNEPEAALRDLEIAVARGFEPRMARRDEALLSVKKLPRFEEVLNHSPGSAAHSRRNQP